MVGSAADDHRRALQSPGRLGPDVVDVNLVDPVHGDELFQGNAVALEFLGGDDVHRTDTPVNDPVRLVAAQLAHRRAHVVAGQRVGKHRELEALAPLQLLQDGNRFMPEGVVDVEIGDLGLLEVGTGLALDVAHHVRRLAPVGGAQGEHRLEDLAIDGVGAAMEGLDHDVAVLHHAGQNGTRHRRGHEVENHHTVTLEALIAFDAALRFVAVVLNRDFDRVAAQTAPAIDQGGVVACRLRHLRRDEAVGLRQVVAQAEANRLRSHRRLTRCRHHKGRQGRAQSE
jgi:hypothetical protein